MDGRTKTQTNVVQGGYKYGLIWMLVRQLNIKEMDFTLALLDGCQEEYKMLVSGKIVEASLVKCF